MLKTIRNIEISQTLMFQAIDCITKIIEFAIVQDSMPQVVSKIYTSENNTIRPKMIPVNIL